MASGSNELNAYVQRLLTTLQEDLGDNLLAVYLFGSAGYGAYEPGISDVDIYVVIHEPLANYHKLARTISHSSIPCPARKLEFVLFTKANAAREAPDPTFEMNFNTGRDMADYINLDPASDPQFWFLIDIAVGRQLGRAIFGPPPAAAFASPRADWLHDAIIESLEWHRVNGRVDSSGVLNACRALRFLKNSTWGSKTEAGNWYLKSYGSGGETTGSAVVKAAVEARRGQTGGTGDLNQASAQYFLGDVLGEFKQSKKHLCL